MKSFSVILASLLASTLTLSSVSAQQDGNGTVYCNGNNVYTLALGIIDKTNPNSCAWGIYYDMINTPSSFGRLSVSTNKAFSDYDQMYAAGKIEGALTALRIAQHFNNTNAWVLGQFKNHSLPPAFPQFFAAQDTWARSQVATNTSSPYWQAMGLILAQFDGLMDGYNATYGSVQYLSKYDFSQMGAMGDILDLIPAIAPSEAINWDTLNDTQLMDRVRKTTHCSALVKVNGDLTELWYGHVAWFIFQSTLRIYKSYQFNVNNPNVVGQEMSFSSYPAYLSSLDDFYAIWSSGIAVLETTNSVFNMSLYQYVQPQSLFAWHRVRMANLLAKDGPEWANIFGYANSGTYNNQYIVVNVGMFKPGGAIPNNLLTIVEQIPSLVVSGDASQELERGYFPSYNVPYFDVIYNMSGYSNTIASRRPNGEPLGELSGIDYQLAPRAKIFRRDVGTVVDTTSYLALLRSNNYKTDPYAQGSPWNAICSRGDLAGSPDGCLDGKGSAASLWANKQAYVVNGPTRNGDPGTIPAFSWSEFPNTPHAGLPYTYNYDFELVQPEWV